MMQDQSVNLSQMDICVINLKDFSFEKEQGNYIIAFICNFQLSENWYSKTGVSIVVC